MSYENPTPLKVGATGTLNGWRVRVAGRIVMGVEIDGATYFWNEYHLLDGSGNAATLVFEETENGYEWKLFRAFTPLRPLSAGEAAAKKVGDMINLDGTPVAITLVDQSRVYYIEGDAPNDLRVADIANYFNADTGSRMLVVSWTGDEVEYYEGLDAPGESIADAFGFPRSALPRIAAANFGSNAMSGFTSGMSGGPRPSGTLLKIVLVVFGLATAFGAYSCFSGGHFGRAATAPPPPKLAAPGPRLTNGAQGLLAQHTYTVTGQAVVEVSRAGSRFDRREYFLRDEAGAPALLINALSGGAKEWHVLRSVGTPSGFTPYDAAQKRRGSPVNLEGRTLPITDLFQSKTMSVEGTATGNASVGIVQYGFVARDAADWLIARWTENQIQFYRGTMLPEADVLEAFARTSNKSK